MSCERFNKRLSDTEKSKILAYNDCGCLRSQIAYLMNRSWHVINNFLSNPIDYGTNKSPGRPKIITAREEIRIINEIKSSPTSIMDIKYSLNLSASKSTIWRFINNCSLLQYIKLDQSPPHKDEHFENRQIWAEEHLSMGDKWLKVIFSDEKKFNLDGLDGNKYYWHHIDNKKRVGYSRNFGGGSLMVWAAIGYHSKSSIVIVNNMNSEDYQIVLNDYLKPVGGDIGGRGWIFQQDNARIHTSISTKNWFTRNKIKQLPWPSYSPDLNIIENVWAILSQRVYGNCVQYKTKADLWVSVQREWDLIPQSQIQNLYNCIPKRVSKVYNDNGNFLIN